MSERVLITDDDPNIRRLLRFILEDEGYTFLEASNGMDALEILQKERVDILILDLMMPLMGGFDTLVNIRKIPSLSIIPVVIISALDRTQDLEDCLKLGVADYFTKPLKQDDIRFIVPMKIKNLIKLKLTQEKLIRAEKLASIACLAAGMAHEINNPLGGVLQNIQLLESRLNINSEKTKKTLYEYGFNDDDIDKLNRYFTDRKIYRYFTFIKDAGSRAAKIVKDLLNFSRKREKKIEANELNSLVDKSIELATSGYDLKIKSIELLKDYSQDNIIVKCDAQEIEQVLLNLIKNAAFELYKLKKEKEDFKPFISFKTYLSGKFCVIQVSDNGPGIDEEILNRIFEPFFTTKEVGEGTGLGLSISYFIIKEEHGGNLRVQSEKGKGTSFFIELPAGG